MKPVTDQDGRNKVFSEEITEIKIDFCLKNRFLALSNKLSGFRRKERYFEITEIKIYSSLQNHFFALSAKLSVFRGKERYFEITL